jgi:hypothetical protein
MGKMQRLSHLYWRAADPVASAIERTKCWLVDAARRREMPPLMHFDRVRYWFLAALLALLWLGWLALGLQVDL